MVGTALDRQGGVAAALTTWRNDGLFERRNILYVATNGSGGGLRLIGRAVKAWFRCAWALGFSDVSLVHVHTSSYVSFWRKSPVMALALLIRRPLIVSLHGGAFREFYAGTHRFGRAWIRLVMRRAMRFVVLTPQWRRWVESTEPSACVCVVPKLRRHCRYWRHSSQTDPTLLLFVGRVEKDKGLFVLLEALASARHHGADWRLVCAGNGDLVAARGAATAHGLSEADVQFVGWVDGDAKRRWFERCALLVLPSFIENMPVAILEAFSYGKPVLATRVGGVRMS